jgi:hypothetical protein
MFTRALRIPGFIIMVGLAATVKRDDAEAGLGLERGMAQLLHKYCAGSRYNAAMRLRIAVYSLPLSLILMLTFALLCTSACTLYKSKPPRTLFDATGGEGMEHVFWKNVQEAKWTEVDRSLASNYVGVTPTGTMDRTAALDQYRSWQLKDSAIGDLKTEMNGNTFVVTYTITLNGTSSSGTAGSQPLPSAPQHMMTVWQQQKAGWIVIAHSVSQQ